MSTTENRSITIRRAESGDAAAIAEIYNHAVLHTEATFDTEPKSVEDREAWLAAHDDRHPVLVAEAQGAIAGWASLTRWSERPAYDLTAEVSFYVRPDWQDHGVGSQLLEQIIAEARRLGYHTLIGRTTATSAASLHISDKYGFRRVGTLQEVGFKFDRFLDVHIVQMML